MLQADGVDLAAIDGPAGMSDIVVPDIEGFLRCTRQAEGQQHLID